VIFIFPQAFLSHRPFPFFQASGLSYIARKLACRGGAVDVDFQKFASESRPSNTAELFYISSRCAPLAISVSRILNSAFAILR
jgi:hypothetical protein